MASIADRDSSSPIILAVASAPERRIIEHSNIATHGIMLLQTGVGPAQVRSMTGVIVAARPAGLISIGTAGGLTADLPPGRLLLPLRVVAEDGQFFPVTTVWHSRVCEQLAHQDIETGPMVSISQPVRKPQDKQNLQSRTGAVAVDMESVELARIASRHSIPFLVIRAVADPHDQPLPHSAIAALTSRGEMRIAGLLGQLLRRPREITGLLRLNTNFRAASRTLDACCRGSRKQISNPGP